jgi:uncharacterized SAM-binding protein YcdF (DUF218 family)
MFLFKKIFSQFFLPLPLTLSISFLGLFLLLFTKRQRLAKVLLSIGLLLIMLFGYSGISNRIIAPLEYQYKPYITNSDIDSLLQTHSSPIEFIVVLGGGHISDPRLPVTSQIQQDTLVRMIEGIRIHRKNPGSKIILSGGMVFDPVSNAEIMASLAKDLGMSEDDMIIESESKDTKDEAKIIQSMIGESPFVLVTSAAHMPRSVALFKKQQMNPIPAPVGHLFKKRQGKLHPGAFFPDAQNIKKIESAFHEYLGILWARLRGQI